VLFPQAVSIPWTCKFHQKSPDNEVLLEWTDWIA